ncbi:MAG: hypothetical protein H6711_05550 [Myxococcales bacterium]|nr:hypothetical protein [Myxococcales bacterium]
MSMQVTVRVRNSAGSHILPGVLVASGEDAGASFGGSFAAEGAHLLLAGDRKYHVRLDPEPSAEAAEVIRDRVGKRVTIRFIGRRGTYRRQLEAIAGRFFAPEAAPEPTSFEAAEAAEAAEVPTHAG